MLKQQALAGSQKYIQLSAWKRLILIAGMLLPGGLLAMFVPSQAAYADGGWWPQSIFICRAGDGGPGGVATNESNGAAGGSGGDCTNGPHGGTGGAGGDHGSAGGPGGSGGPGAY
jgi:hypothetical protein